MINGEFSLPGHQLSPRERKGARAVQITVIILAVLYLSELFLDSPLQAYIDQHWGELAASTQMLVKVSSFKTGLLNAVSLTVFLAPILFIVGVCVFIQTIMKVSPLSIQTAKAVQMVGVLVLMYGLIDLLGYTLMLGVMTYDAPAGHRHFFIYIKIHHIAISAMGFILLFLSSTIRTATDAADEIRQIV